MNKYIFASAVPWHKKTYREKVKKLPGRWFYIERPEDLTIIKIDKINPKYIFFPHWRWKVPNEIINSYKCICFHETDLPFGRGGSPIQNLIYRGYKNTVISAIKMISELDAGPIYLKRKLSLDGSAQDIYIHSSEIIFRMIKEIIKKKITPKPQVGKTVYFKRRKPAQSKIPKSIETLDELYDFIRMLDAEGYPHAYISYSNLEIIFQNASLKEDILSVNARIKLIKGKEI